MRRRCLWIHVVLAGHPLMCNTGGGGSLLSTQRNPAHPRPRSEPAERTIRPRDASGTVFAPPSGRFAIRMPQGTNCRLQKLKIRLDFSRPWRRRKTPTPRTSTRSPEVRADRNHGSTTRRTGTSRCCLATPTCTNGRGVLS